MLSYKKSLTALAAAAALTAANGASATLTNWYLDTNGAAAGGLISVVDYLDVNGKSFVTIDSVPSPTYTFSEAGIGTIALADGSTLLPNIMRTEISATGTGDISTGKIVFNAGGLVRFYNSADVVIATFSLVMGDGQLLSGTVLPNGNLSLISQAVSLAPGYFFDSGMNDLSTMVGSGLTFGLLTTNAIYPVTMTASDKALLASTYNTAFGTSLSDGDIADTPTTLLISNNGQFRFDIPEPASMALVGLGLGAVAVMRRRPAA